MEHVVVRCSGCGTQVTVAVEGGCWLALDIAVNPQRLCQWSQSHRRPLTACPRMEEAMRLRFDRADKRASAKALAELQAAAE